MNDHYSLESIQGMICKNYPDWEKDIQILYLERRIVQLVQQMMRQELLADKQRSLLKNIIAEHEISIKEIQVQNSRLSKLQKELKKAKSHLESKVEKRTAELKRKNVELENKTANLEESNIAMDVLLRRNDQELKNLLKQSMEKLRNKIFSDLNELAVLADTENQKTLIYRIMNNIQQDTPEEYNHNWNICLSGRQAAVAGLIAQGMTHAKVAEVLHVSIRTVNSHCYKIRRKFKVPAGTRLKDYLNKIS